MDEDDCWLTGSAGRRGRRSSPTGGCASSRRSAARSPCGREDTGVTQYAYTAGGPNSCVVGDDGDPVRLPERRHGRSVAGRGDVGAVDPADRAGGRPGRDHRDRDRRDRPQRAQRPRLRTRRPALLHRPGHVSTVGSRAVTDLRPRRVRPRRPRSSSSSRRRSRTASPSRPTAASCGPSRTPGWSDAAGPTARASRTSACCPATTPSPTDSPSPPTAGCSSPPSTAAASTCSTPTERTTSSSRPGRSRPTACSTAPAC